MAYLHTLKKSGEDLITEVRESVVDIWTRHYCGNNRTNHDMILTLPDGRVCILQKRYINRILPSKVEEPVDLDNVLYTTRPLPYRSFDHSPIALLTTPPATKMGTPLSRGEGRVMFTAIGF